MTGQTLVLLEGAVKSRYLERLGLMAKAFGVKDWFPYQRECFDDAIVRQTYQADDPRTCLYYKTGAGKSVTALVCMALWEEEEVLVIAPPSTHKEWVATGEKLGIKVHTMSHQKFRMPGTKMQRDLAVIADEMHMFGGHGGQGWLKLRTLAKGLKAPLVMASATPNYNDADRVFCIQSILDPGSVKGGFLQFLYAHCTTEQNPFGMMPNVTGFQRYTNAADYLADLEGVFYLPDDLQYKIGDTVLNVYPDAAFENFGYDVRKHKIMASGIEEKHTKIFNALVHSDHGLHRDVWTWVKEKIQFANGPVLIYCNHSTVAQEVMFTLNKQADPMRMENFGLITGKTSAKDKQAILDLFRSGGIKVLVGTASLATGTDGLDKVCDTLIILDDTEDDSLRRQLIGRIMPRGSDKDASKKQVHRLVLQ